MSASIGFTELDAGADPARALAEADAAMREAKSRDDHVARFESAHSERYATELSLQIELQHALERQEFRLHYQPIIRCVDASVIGFEALLRWEHPTRGLLAPGAFLDALVEANLLVAVGNWVAAETVPDLQPLFANLPAEAADLDDRRRNTVDGLASSLRLAGTGAQVPRWTELPRLRMPVLVLAGEHDERFAALGRRMAAAIGGNSTFATVPGAGHAAHLERPDAFLAVLRAFPSS
jgi:pimeloyl-ACP methyl ester carboxylesterase